MIKQPTELQNFLGAYFHQDWSHEYSSADDAINSFIKDSTKETIIKVIAELIAINTANTSEKDLLRNLLNKQYCYYYPSEWESGKSWIEYVIKKLSSHLTTTN